MRVRKVSGESALEMEARTGQCGSDREECREAMLAAIDGGVTVHS